MPKVKPQEPALFGDGELAAAPDNIVRDAQDCYNETAKGLPWRASTSLTEARRTALRRAVKDYGGLAGFRAAMERAAKSPFLLGKTGRTGIYKTWKPTLAFFCQPKSIENLMDGVYDPEPEETKRLVLPTTWKPPHLRDQKPFVPEPIEVRLASSIVSYRKIGNYARANEIELRLAEIEKRPPVLVPSPDARDPDVVPPKPMNGHDKPAPTVKTGSNYANPMQAGGVTDVVDQYDYDGVPEGQYEIEGED